MLTQNAGNMEPSQSTGSGNPKASMGNKETNPCITCRSMEHPNKKKKGLDAEEYVINYIQSETKESCQENPRRQFLLSLLSDLEEMSLAQFR